MLALEVALQAAGELDGIPDGKLGKLRLKRRLVVLTSGQQATTS